MSLEANKRIPSQVTSRHSFESERFEADGDFFSAKQKHRRAFTAMTVAMRRLYYFELALDRLGESVLSAELFGIRCVHIRALSTLWVGDAEEPRVCAEYHFENRRVQIPCDPADENQS